MTIAMMIADRSGEVWHCHAEDRVADAVETLATRRIGALPVTEAENEVAGIFSERDVLYALKTYGAAALNMQVREVMTAPVISVSPATTALEALGLMTRRRVRHLPVIDNGRMVGFVSIGDLVKFRIDRIEAEADALRVYIQSA